jgi:hypothetical protein
MTLFEPAVNERVEIHVRGKKVLGTVEQIKGTRYFVRLDKPDPHLGAVARVTSAFLQPPNGGQTVLL